MPALAVLSIATAAVAAEPPGSWSCVVNKVNSYTGYSYCYSIPSGHHQRVALTCYDGVAGKHYVVLGPAVGNRVKSQASCSSSVRDAVTLVDVQAL